MYHFRDYFWKNGTPRGKNRCSKEESESYKIVIDPYFKRISLEKFQKGIFLKTIYDSYLLDFRHLKPNEQTAWQKIPYGEKASPTTCLIVNQDDRAILWEKYAFIGELCRECHISSIHGIAIALQRMFYVHLGDSFNGVILYDPLNQPVMIKKYAFDSTSNSFSDLILEEWDMSNSDSLKESLESH